MIKHRLPSREVLERYAPTIRFSLIRSYHRKLAQKHRWFVREWQDEIVAEWQATCDYASKEVAE